MPPPPFFFLSFFLLLFFAQDSSSFSPTPLIPFPSQIYGCSVWGVCARGKSSTDLPRCKSFHYTNVCAWTVNLFRRNDRRNFAALSVLSKTVWNWMETFTAAHIHISCTRICLTADSTWMVAEPPSSSRQP